MATSHSLGAPSSLPRANVLALLAELCRSPQVLQLQSALGPDGDLHLVGGTVRDVITDGNTSATDLDMATALRPEQTLQRLEAQAIRVVPTGLKHGTVTAVFGTLHIEVTTFRHVWSEGERTHAGFADSIEQDLKGRDFTINALAYSLSRREIVDHCNGWGDIEQRVLRAVGDPAERFRDDPLRLLRMIRFGPAQGRTIDSSTMQAAGQAIDSLGRISIERIRSELVKILVSKHAGAALREMQKLGLLERILPEVLPSVGFEQNEYHRFDVFEHTLEVINHAPASDLLRLTALFHDLGKPHTLSVDESGFRHFYKHELISTDLTRQAMERLKFSNDLTRDVSLLVQHHMRPLECGPAGVRRIMRDLGQLLNDWMDFKRADSLGAKVTQADIDAALDKFRSMVKEERERPVGSPYSSLAIDGNDLIALGMREGKAVGEMLKRLQELVLDTPELNTREELTTRARSWLAKQE